MQAVMVTCYLARTIHEPLINLIDVASSQALSPAPFQAKGGFPGNMEIPYWSSGRCIIIIQVFLECWGYTLSKQPV